MSVHDYFKPIAPKQSKKNIWQIFIPSQAKPYPVRLPKIIKEKNHDLKSSVSIISLPALTTSKESKKIDLIYQVPGRSNAFKVTQKLLKKSGIKMESAAKAEIFDRKRQKSKETARMFIKQEIFRLEYQKAHEAKACNTEGDVLETFDTGESRLSLNNVRSLDYIKLNLGSVRTNRERKPIEAFTLNKRRKSSTKESLSLPLGSNDEFELRGW